MTQFFEIDFLEAGEKGSGDAIALRYREEDEPNYIHVVDGGYKDDGKKLIEHIEKYYDRPSKIDHVVLTHPDGDHAAGLEAVLEEFEVGTLWMNRPWEYVEDLLELFEYDYTTDGLYVDSGRTFLTLPNWKIWLTSEELASSPHFGVGRLGRSQCWHLVVNAF